MTHTQAHVDSRAIQINRLAQERQRLAAAKTDKERDLRAVWVKQIEQEIAHLDAMIGDAAPAPGDDVSDADLLAELGL